MYDARILRIFAQASAKAIYFSQLPWHDAVRSWHPLHGLSTFNLRLFQTQFFDHRLDQGPG